MLSDGPILKSCPRLDPMGQPQDNMKTVGCLHRVYDSGLSKLYRLRHADCIAEPENELC
jgi:hypothetical protein